MVFCRVRPPLPDDSIKAASIGATGAPLLLPDETGEELMDATTGPSDSPGLAPAQRAPLLKRMSTNGSTLGATAELVPSSGASAATASTAALFGPGPGVVIDVLGDTELAFYDKSRRAWRPFAYDRVFGPDSDQLEVYREVCYLYILFY
jgi:hypothetical protein